LWWIQGLPFFGGPFFLPALAIAKTAEQEL
jgi:hypothetical protein